ACCRRKQAEPMCGLARIDLFWASLVWLSERMGRVAFQKGVYWYKSSEVSPEGCRVDSGHMLCCRGSNLRTDDIRPEPNARGIIGAAWAKCCSRLPTHLAHPLENELAVVIHALGTSLQGSRQNRGKPCRLLPANIPGRGSIVVTTRRLCTINTRAPFDHVEVDLQNAPLAEDEFGHRYQCELRALTQERAARSEE